MKAKNLFFLLLIFILGSCAQNKPTPANNPTTTQNAANQKTTAPPQTTTKTQHPKPVVEPQKNTTPSITKHGVTYTLPASWKNKTEEFKATDLKGNIVSIQSDYQDTNDQSTIHVTFHPGEKGKKIYAYKLKKLGKNSKRINIGNQEAIQTIELLKIDGKGHPLNVPTKRIIVSLLTDEGEMDFILNANSQASEKTFNDFISKMEF